VDPKEIAPIDKRLPFLSRQNRDNVRRMAAITASDIAARSNAVLSQKQTDREMARAVKHQEANIAMGRFVNDMERSAYERSQRPADELTKRTDVIGKQVGVLGQIQAQELARNQEDRNRAQEVRSAQKHGWEGQDRVTQSVTGLLDLQGKADAQQAAREHAAREQQKFDLEKQGLWTPNMPQPDTAAPASTPGPAAPKAGNPPTLSPQKAATQTPDTLYRGLDGKLRRR
jgi:hypothetical protein